MLRLFSIDMVSGLNIWGPLTTGQYLSFDNIFEGNGHTINLDINAPAGIVNAPYGMFSSIGQGGVVRDLRLTGRINVGTALVGSGDNSHHRGRIGAVAGEVRGNGQIFNVMSSVEITVTGGNLPTPDEISVGGIAGSVEGVGASIFRNVVTGAINVNSNGANVGGIVGAVSRTNSGSNTIRDNWASGNITGKRIGGIVGSIFINHAQGNVLLANNVAIMSSLSNCSWGTTAAYRAGRIAALSTGSNINNLSSSNNYGNSALTVTTGNSEINGAQTVTIAQANTQSWWQNASWSTPNGFGTANWGTTQATPWVWSGVSPPTGIPANRPVLWFVLP